MLPYFHGMEAFSIFLPKSWSELSDQQLLFFFRQVARDLPMNEVCLFVSSLSHIARYAPSFTNKNTHTIEYKSIYQNY